jgi:hypothetical protein
MNKVKTVCAMVGMSFPIWRLSGLWARTNPGPFEFSSDE